MDVPLTDFAFDSDISTGFSCGSTIKGGVDESVVLPPVPLSVCFPPDVGLGGVDSCSNSASRSEQGKEWNDVFEKPLGIVISGEYQDLLLQIGDNPHHGTPLPKWKLLAPILNGVVYPFPSVHFMIAAINPVVKLLKKHCLVETDFCRQGRKHHQRDFLYQKAAHVYRQLRRS